MGLVKKVLQFSHLKMVVNTRLTLMFLACHFASNYHCFNNSNQLHRRLPNVIVFGVRKGGTRAVLTYLSLHPNISTAVKEAHYFDRPNNYQMGVQWYRSRMPLSLPNQITVEKTPAYFHTPSVAKRVYLFNPKVKLILVIRHPITRILSDYAQVFYTRKRKGKSHESLHKLLLINGELLNVNYKPLIRSLYDLHFRRYLKYFSLSNIHIVDGDLLIKNPYSEMKSVESFLSLPAELQPEMFYFNKTRRFFCIRGKYGKSSCLPPSKGRKHSKLSPHLFKLLSNYLRPHADAFYRLCNRNFTWNL